MIRCFIILIFIFVVNCTFNENKSGISKKNLSSYEIDFSKVYSFEEYVNLLSKKSRYKTYPDINNFPD